MSKMYRTLHFPLLISLIENRLQVIIEREIAVMRVDPLSQRCSYSWIFSLLTYIEVGGGPHLPVF